MQRNLYSPRLSNDVVRTLYREGRRRGMPMTRLADLLLRDALGISGDSVAVVSETVLNRRRKAAA